MIPEQLLNSTNTPRTHDTYQNMLDHYNALKNNPAMLDAAIKTLETTLNYPFYRFFSNYGTGIGETMEEVAARKFTDIIPKKDGKKKSKVYEDYNNRNNKKPSNYDFLITVNGVIKSGEAKVIRAAESKPKQQDKIYELPSLLEERALTYDERNASGNQTFQQTKAELFDYLLGIVIYADQVDFYLVPSGDIKSGKLKITNQHAGAILEDGSTNEGHLSVKDLDSYKVLSVYNEKDLMAADTLAKYIK